MREVTSNGGEGNLIWEVKLGKEVSGREVSRREVSRREVSGREVR